MKIFSHQTLWMIIIPCSLFLIIKLVLNINLWLVLSLLCFVIWIYKSFFEDVHKIKDFMRNTGATLLIILFLSRYMSLDFVSKSVHNQVLIPLLVLSLICYSICWFRESVHTS